MKHSLSIFRGLYDRYNRTIESAAPNNQGQVRCLHPLVALMAPFSLPIRYARANTSSGKPVTTAKQIPVLKFNNVDKIIEDLLHGADPMPLHIEGISFPIDVLLEHMHEFLLEVSPLEIGLNIKGIGNHYKAYQQILEAMLHNSLAMAYKRILAPEAFAIFYEHIESEAEAIKEADTKLHMSRHFNGGITTTIELFLERFAPKQTKNTKPDDLDPYQHPVTFRKPYDREFKANPEASSKAKTSPKAKL